MRKDSYNFSHIKLRDPRVVPADQSTLLLDSAILLNQDK